MDQPLSETPDRFEMHRDVVSGEDPSEFLRATYEMTFFIFVLHLYFLVCSVTCCFDSFADLTKARLVASGNLDINLMRSKYRADIADSETDAFYLKHILQ